MTVSDGSRQTLYVQHKNNGTCRCGECGEEFNQKLHLFEHLEKHKIENTISQNDNYRHLINTGPTSYDCNICDRMFIDMAFLNKHIKTHYGQTPYNCTECEMRFNDCVSLQEHLQSHIDDLSRKAKYVIGVPFHSPSSTDDEVSVRESKTIKSSKLTKNKTIQTKQPNELKCVRLKVVDISGKEFKTTKYCASMKSQPSAIKTKQSKQSKQSPVSKNHTESLRKSQVESKSTSTTLTTSKESQRNKRKPRGIFNTSTHPMNSSLTLKRGEAIKSENELQIMINSGNKGIYRRLFGDSRTENKTIGIGVSKESLFHCEKCDEKFSNKTDLEIHWHNHNEDKVMYSCKVCKTNFPDLTKLKFHAANRSCSQPKLNRIGSKKKRHPCHLCPRVYNSITQLKVHINKHNGVKPFKCNLCGMAFSGNSALKAHVERHSRIGFKCEKCGRICSSKKRLTLHMTLHTGKKMFKCDTCNKSYVDKCALKVHSWVHSGGGDHACNDCDKRFPSKHHLERHLVVHTRARPFKCSECLKCFSTKGSLKKHMEIHRGDGKFV